MMSWHIELHTYCKAERFGKFVELSAIHLHQTKTIHISSSSNNPLADLFIHQTFVHQMLNKSKFAKHTPYQAFLLFGRLLFAYLPCLIDKFCLLYVAN